MKLCPKCQKQFDDDANFCPVDAARLVPLAGQSPEAADPLAQRFDLGPRLGGSRTGAVHRAVDKQGGGTAVVKLISPAVVALPGVAQRIERELKQLERVQSVGCARVLGSGRRGEDWWVAYELLDGAQTLAEAISARGPLPIEQSAHLIEVIGEALIEAAQVGVVHRDLAPKNILFAGADIKLINFSVPVPGERTPGVPEFVAPEQVEGKPVDQRSNLYSLGALYYYVLTGQPVHAGTPEEVLRAHVNGAIKPPSSLAPVPGPVEAVIVRALDRSPTKRFLTVRQFVDEVGRVARGEASVRTTLPLGKAGRPKAELVQTLLGMRAITATPAAGVPVVAAGGTMPGVGSNPAIATAPPVAAPVAVAEPPAAVPPPERSPWAPPQAVPPEPAPSAAATTELEPVSAASSAATTLVAGAAAAAPEAASAKPAVVEPQAVPAITDAPRRAPSQAGAPEPVPPPQVTNAPGPAPQKGKDGKDGKDGAEADGKGNKGKFRETLWFKKGELDSEAAQASAEERARSGRDTGGERVDSLPMDERYKDDGSISRKDKEKYSLRTGSTESMQKLRDAQTQSNPKMSEDSLISEMKAGRGKILALIGLAAVVLIVIVVLAAS